MEVRLYDGKDSMFTIFEDDRIDPNPSRTSTIITFFWLEINHSIN